MAMLHQKLDAMSFKEIGRIAVGNTLKDVYGGHVQFITSGSAFVGPNLARTITLDSWLVLNCLKSFRGNGSFGNDALDDSGAIAKDRKEQLAALAKVVEPSPNLDFLAFVAAPRESWLRKVARSSKNLQPGWLLPEYSLPLGSIPQFGREIRALKRLCQLARRRLLCFGVAVDSSKSKVIGASRSSCIDSFHSTVPSPGHRWLSISPLLSCTWVESTWSRINSNAARIPPAMWACPKSKHRPTS